MSLNVTGHYPSVNAENVYCNETVRIYFSQPLQPSTLTWETFSVNDSNSFTSVVGTVGAGYSSSGQIYEMNFTPTTMLIPNNKYNVYVFGPPNSVMSTLNENLDQTYFYSFTTGTGYYTTTGATGVPSGIFPTIINQDALINFSGLYIRGTYPQHKQPNVPISGFGGIEIYFNMPLSTSLSDISGMIAVATEEVYE